MEGLASADFPITELQGECATTTLAEPWVM